MKKVFIILTFITILFTSVFAQNDSLPVPVTFRVDMSNETAMDVYVAGSFQDDILGGNFVDWTPGTNDLEQVCGNFWQALYMIPPGDYQYKYYLNGSAFTDAEPLGYDYADCTVFYASNRAFTVEPNTPLLLDRYFFNSCDTTQAIATVIFRADFNNFLTLNSLSSVSIVGNFQEFIGGTNWTAGDLQMTDDDDDGVYEIEIDLPEGSYEYKFVAGDDLIYSEILPNNENRKFTAIACTENLYERCFNEAIVCEEQESPINVTFQVDMNGTTTDGSGVFVAGDFQFPAWQKNVLELSDDDNDNIYETTVQMIPANYEFKFYNGTDGNATSDALKDISFYPNPIKDFLMLKIDNNNVVYYDVVIHNIFGQQVYEAENKTENLLHINSKDFLSGIYFVSVYLDEVEITTKKIIVE